MIDIETLEQILSISKDRAQDTHRALVLALPERQECEPTAPRNEMDTFGSLVDKLITVDLKMWHNQERLYEIRRMSREEFCERWGEDLGGLHDVVKRCCDLNVQRASLIDEIDKFLLEAVSGERSVGDLIRPQHKTY